MSGRVLNFSEFFDKYSKDSTDNKKSLDSFTQSSSNFEVGFDQDTYSQTQIGPNRPISSEKEATPAQPGEEGTSFNSEADSEMDAPEQVEEPTEELDTPEPEAGSNPKKENKKMSESIELKNFIEFVNEFHGAEYVSDSDWDDNESDPFAEEDSETCDTCNKPIMYIEDEVVCGCNM